MIWRRGGRIDLKIVPIRHHAPIAAAHGRPYGSVARRRNAIGRSTRRVAGLESQATLGSSSTTTEGPKKLLQYDRPGEDREVASQSIEAAHEKGRIKPGSRPLK